MVLASATMSPALQPLATAMALLVSAASVTSALCYPTRSLVRRSIAAVGQRHELAEGEQCGVVGQPRLPDL
jgi:hypothetical protein